MKPDEQIKALRYCADSKGPCSECPGWTGKYDDDCMVFHIRQAADLIEQLTAENAELRRDSEALYAALDVGTVAMERRGEADG